MLIELSPLEVKLIIRRFDEAEQKDLEEQLLVQKLRSFDILTSEPAKRTYLQDFKKEPPLPPMPEE